MRWRLMGRCMRLKTAGTDKRSSVRSLDPELRVALIMSYDKNAHCVITNFVENVVWKSVKICAANSTEFLA
jgi:hypothetical protein